MYIGNLIIVVSSVATGIIPGTIKFLWVWHKVDMPKELTLVLPIKIWTLILGCAKNLILKLWGLYYDGLTKAHQ